jgi:beta-lactamase superfamily II metal-dependent hydrolase
MPDDDAIALDPSKRLMPPPNGAVVRMYRIGHGDCFLIAFAGDDEDEPVYVLIDCGYKPGSPGFINTTAAEITQNIREATGGHIDIAVITHEHQDHVNGITEKNFDGITIDKTWLAWTEDPKDDVANTLRKIYKDKLLGLIAARNQLAAGGEPKRTQKIDTFLAFELGGDVSDENFDAHAAKELLGVSGSAAGGSMNKKSMKIFKDRAKNGVKFLLPHEEIEPLPGATSVRVFAFGPPRNVEELQDLDPQGKEEFHGLAMASSGNYFAAAAVAADANAGERTDKPFARRYQVEWKNAVSGNEQAGFFKTHYGQKGDAPIFELNPDMEEPDEDKIAEISSNAEWRRIDTDWLYSGEQLALAMNNDTNNASLVLAFELGKGGKVLLFAGDAQRGNWISWSKGDWTDGGEKVTVKDLLSRAVLYKVGHHCSHNATLNGLSTDDYPNIGWMATGKYANEFVAMITAVRAWAETQKGWNHPFKAIKDELIKKASGRVFQTDTDFDKMPSENASQIEWEAFKARTAATRLYFDCQIPA